MADKISKKLADAYSRKDRIPIKITDIHSMLEDLRKFDPDAYSNDKSTEVSGSYYPDNHQVNLDIPAAGSSPSEISDVLKHELVHHIINKVAPTHEQTLDNFKATPEQPGLFGHLFNDPYATASPYDDYNFGKSNRVGQFKQEIPAYMSIYEPNKFSQVTQYQRDQYMKDLYEYLHKIKQDTVASKIQELIFGRSQYNETGLFPTKNVGEK